MIKEHIRSGRLFFQNCSLQTIGHCEKSNQASTQKGPLENQKGPLRGWKGASTEEQVGNLYACLLLKADPAQGHS
jgi:hypothetical protein